MTEKSTRSIILHSQKEDENQVPGEYMSKVYRKINTLMMMIFAVVSSWEQLSLFKHALLIYAPMPILFALSAYLKIKLKCDYFYCANFCLSLQE